MGKADEISSVSKVSEEWPKNVVLIMAPELSSDFRHSRGSLNYARWVLLRARIFCRREHENGWRLQ